MPNKHRCTFCREYFQREEMLAQGVGGVCSVECLHGLQERARAKRARRTLHKEMRHSLRHTGRRIPGPERKLARARDKDRCRWCGTDQNTQLHHVIYRSEGGPDRAYNLLTLCEKHHAQAHSNKRLYQPVLLHVLRTKYSLTVPRALASMSKEDRDLAIEWGRDVRHGQAA